MPTPLEIVPSLPLASYPLITKTALILAFANSIFSLSAGSELCFAAQIRKKKIFNSFSSLQIVSKRLNLRGTNQPLLEQ